MAGGARWSSWELKQHQDKQLEKRLDKKLAEDGNEEKELSFADRMRLKHGAKPAVNTNAFTNQVVEELSRRGFEVSRNNTMGVFDMSKAPGVLATFIMSYAKGKAALVQPKKGNKSGRALLVYNLGKILRKCFRKSHERKGMPDIIGLHRETGVFIGVEIKTGTDKLRPEQIRQLELINKCNGIGIVARKMNDVIERIEKWERERM